MFERYLASAMVVVCLVGVGMAIIMAITNIIEFIIEMKNALPAVRKHWLKIGICRMFE